MSIVPVNTLKSYFETGDRPTQPQFASTIDTLIAAASSLYVPALGAKVGQPKFVNGRWMKPTVDVTGALDLSLWEPAEAPTVERFDFAPWTAQELVQPPANANNPAQMVVRTHRGAAWRFISTTARAGVEPGIHPDSPTVWLVLVGSSGIFGDPWEAVLYKRGEVVRRNLGLYVLEPDNQAIQFVQSQNFANELALGWWKPFGYTMSIAEQQVDGSLVTKGPFTQLTFLGGIRVNEQGQVSVEQNVRVQSRQDLLGDLTHNTGIPNPATPGQNFIGIAPLGAVVVEDALGGTARVRVLVIGPGEISGEAYNELTDQRGSYNVATDVFTAAAAGQVAPVVITIGVAQLPVNGAQSTNPAGANYYPPSGSTGNWGSEIANRPGQIYKISGSNIYFHYTQAGAENAFAWRAGENETPAWDFGFVRLSDGAFLKLDEYLYPTWQASVSANTVSFGLPAGQQNFGVENRPLDVAFATLETSQSILTFNDQQPLNARFFGLKIRNTSATNSISINLPNDYKRTDSTLPVLQIPPLSEGLLSVYNDFAAGVGGRLLHWEPAYRARNRRYRARLTIDDLNMTATVDHVFETDFGTEINWEVVDASGDLQLRSGDWATIVVVGGSPTVYRPVAYHLSALYSNSGSGISSFTGVPLGICEDFNNPQHINLYKDGRPGPFVVHIDATVYYDEGL